MLEVDLSTSIEKFVKTFHVVRMRHLRNFFMDRGDETNRVAMRYLMNYKILHKHKTEDFLSLIYPSELPSPLYTYAPTLKCLDMLTNTLKSSEVLWYDIADYPLNLRFLTVAEELYDVTYMDDTNWVQKYTLLPIAWKKGVPVGQRDPVNHIAVVPKLEVAMKLRDLNFSQFIVVDHNGAVLGIYDNE